MNDFTFRYTTGSPVRIGDRIAIDALDGRGIVNTGRVADIFTPHTADAANYSCVESGGVLIEFDDGDLQLWVEVDEHLVCQSPQRNKGISRKQGDAGAEPAGK